MERTTGHHHLFPEDGPATVSRVNPSLDANRVTASGTKKENCVERAERRVSRLQRTCLNVIWILLDDSCHIANEIDGVVDQGSRCRVTLVTTIQTSRSISTKQLFQLFPKINDYKGSSTNLADETFDQSNFESFDAFSSTQSRDCTIGS